MKLIRAWLTIRNSVSQSHYKYDQMQSERGLFTSSKAFEQKDDWKQLKALLHRIRYG